MGFVAKLKRLLLPKQIEYTVERPYDISTGGHIIGLVLLYLIGIPGVAVWVVLTAITEVHTFTSTVLYEETPTWRGGFFNSTSCDPVVLQPGQRFYTSTGVFQYEYVGGADSQVEARKRAYQGSNISTCDMAMTFTDVSSGFRSIDDTGVATDIYVICNTTDLNALLRTSTGSTRERGAIIIDGHGKQAEDSPFRYNNLDEKAKRSQNVDGIIQMAASRVAGVAIDVLMAERNKSYTDLVTQLYNYHLIAPVTKGCWNANGSDIQKCFNTPITRETSLISYWSSRVWQGKPMMERNGNVSDATLDYLITVHSAVRYDFGSPGNYSIFSEGYNNTTTPVLDLAYTCRTRKWPAAPTIVTAFLTAFYSVFQSWSQFVKLFYKSFAKKQQEDQDDDDDKTTPPAQKYSSVRTEG